MDEKPEVIIWLHEDGSHDIENLSGVKVIIRDFNADPNLYHEGQVLDETCKVFKDEDSENEDLYIEYVYGK